MKFILPLVAVVILLGVVAYTVHDVVEKIDQQITKPEAGRR